MRALNKKVMTLACATCLTVGMVQWHVLIR